MPNEVTQVELAMPAPPVRKCEILNMIGATINELLQSSPTNAVVRAQVMNCIGQRIPPELVEYDKIKDWIELNIEKPLYHNPHAGTSTIAIEVGVTHAYTESGACNWSRRVRGRGAVPLMERTIRNMVHNTLDNDGTLEDVVRNLRALVRGDAPSYTDGDGDYSYDGYECEGQDEIETTISTDMSDMVRTWLDANMPDELNMLYENE